MKYTAVEEPERRGIMPQGSVSQTGVRALGRATQNTKGAPELTQSGVCVCVFKLMLV